MTASFSVPYKEIHMARPPICLSTFAALLIVLLLATTLSSCGSDPRPADDSLDSQAAPTSCSETDRAALTALFNATDGPNWHDNTNWLSQQPLSTWFGVTTAENGCVSRLHLKNNNLTGELAPELGTLPELLYLNLRDNNLTGQFPLEWENAANITNLYVFGNNFSGCFPNQFAHLEKGILRDLHELISQAPTGVKIDVSIGYCDTSRGRFPLNSALSTPSNLSYTLQGSSIILHWDPVAGADHYILYHDDFYDSRCRLTHLASPKFCRQLATVHGETTYTHVEPPGGRNFYWVRACNSSGCSPLISENTASPPAGSPVRLGIDFPPTPSNFTYAFEGTSVILSWDPVEGADYYNLYYHHRSSIFCMVESDGTSGGCDLLAANLTTTTYTHVDPEKRTNFWVAACSSVGCSPFQAESPVRPVEDIPPVPSNLTFAPEGSSIVVSWDPVDEADYYNLYHHHAFGNACIVYSDGFSTICKQLATGLTETTFTHTELDRRNFYWVAACNRGGCSHFEVLPSD